MSMQTELYQMSISSALFFWNAPIEATYFAAQFAAMMCINLVVHDSLVINLPLVQPKVFNKTLDVHILRPVPLVVCWDNFLFIKCAFPFRPPFSPALSGSDSDMR